MRYPVARRLLLAVLSLVLSGSPVFAAPFTAGATVVVLTGLPGDVESETAYRDQTRRLLEVLAGGQPAGVILLTDAPEGMASPEVEVRAGTRAEFLALAGRLAGKPLVVFAWGHGGMQGETPVFHVRGPRITPQDFKALAGKAGPSQWVLQFRGSGAVARALRDAGREVISSEDETPFRSDPVGMELVLQALREEPGLSFTELAEELGRAAFEWYEERRLARQEEPTLWMGTAPPRRLAAKREEARPSVRRVERAGVWAEVAPVDPARYPGADAVVLRRRFHYTLGRSPAVAGEVEEIVQVLTAEGVRHGDFDVAFAPPAETVTFLDCEVLKPDGTVERLDPDRIGDAGVAPLGDYVPPARKVFSLPSVTPGALLRVRYRTEWKSFPLPHILLELPLAGELPVVDARVEVRVASGSPLHFGFRNLAPVQPAVEPGSYGTSYSWRFADLPAAAAEALAPPDVVPRLLLSTFPDWEAFSGWYRRLIREADTVTPEIAAQAAAVTAGARTEREKVVALYDFVARLRYVAIPLGVNSHRPHAAANVLANRYGDCKDKANLFNTLLRSLGIAADLVLVPRFTQADDALPGLAFNHAISRVTVGGETLWIDTTDDVARFGLLPPGDPGRKVLVVADGEGRGLVRLPDPEPAAHGIVLKARLQAGKDGNFAGSVEVQAKGSADYALRAAARQAAGQGATRPVLAEGFQPVAGAFAAAEQSHTPVAALDRDFAWRAAGAWSGLTSRLPAGGRLLRAPFWLPREWEEALHARRTPLFLNAGYPLSLEETVEIVLPPGAVVGELPAVRENGDGPLRWKVEWTRAGEETVTTRLRLALATGELGGEETEQFQRQLGALLAALGEGGSYVQP